MLFKIKTHCATKTNRTNQLSSCKLTADHVQHDHSYSLVTQRKEVWARD